MAEEMAGAPLPPGRATGAEEQYGPSSASYPITCIAFSSLLH